MSDNGRNRHTPLSGRISRENGNGQAYPQENATPEYGYIEEVEIPQGHHEVPPNPPHNPTPFQFTTPPSQENARIPGVGSVQTPGFADYNQPQTHFNPYGTHQQHATPQFVEDQDFYEQPHAGPTYPYEQTPYPQRQPHYQYPEEPEAYPLKPYPDQQMPSFDNSYEESYGVGDEESVFRPFPISGDQYVLNTYDEDEDSTPTVASEEGDDDDDDDDDDDEYSYQSADPYEQNVVPPPVQPRRAKTMRRVRLYRGNLVLDCPVSKKLLAQLPEPRMEREFTHMRYSAATCDPSQFVTNQFTLRQTCYQTPRQTELFIVVTLYKEDEILLGRTLQGIFKNIKHLSSRTRSKTWGKDAWKKVVVCVVADGRFVIHPRTKALLAALGVYQDGFAKNIVNDRPVAAHIYEYTTMVDIQKVDKTVKLTTDKSVPVQMIFCLKEKNQQKINSHRWFFQAFGPILNPKVCVLLDAGTMPGHDSIYHLWKTFDVHPNVGGACGEIKAYLGSGWNKLLNPLVAAQNFEYKMSNILDKPLESSFGFISVLPGAFSAYRYVALQNNLHGQGPLAQYFKGETLHDSGAGIFTANMYLAEDRILCFELVAKRNENWLLKYVKSAHAETDVPEGFAELVLQRRRWLNGSFFAAIYAQAHLLSIWRSAHSLGRKLMLHVEFMYQLFSMLFSWFSIGNFFLVFRILTSSLGDSSLGFAPGNVLGVIFLWIYGGCMITIFVLSFGNRPKGTHVFYIIIVAFFAVLMTYLLFAAIYISVKSVEYSVCVNGGFSVSLVFGNQTFRDLVVSMMSTYALYFVSAFLFFEPWHMLTSFVQYLLISPAYVNVLNVYAFCNIHDISWGTKGDTEQKTDLGIAKTNEAGKLEVDIPTHVDDIDSSYMEQITTLSVPVKEESTKPSKEDASRDYYALFRSSVVLSWIFTNVIIIVVVLNTAGLSAITSGGGTASTSTLGKRAGDEMLDVLMNRAANANCGSLGSTVDGPRTQIYLSVVLWAVAALAAFRFVGCIYYLVTRLLGR